ncbi:MAG: hypothetical protein LBB10_03190 [Bifidobacteriaceae bacterium]|jgi:hypothetical protein|nr:hypothetical protein [Bifidobacteriaceae bacterium]
MNTKIKPQKIGTIITVLLFGAICAIGGYELRSSTDSNSSVLPIAKGGTSANTAETARDNLSLYSKSEIDTKFANTGQKVTVSITLNNGAYFNFGSSEAKFIGYKQTNGDILGYVEIDAYVTIATGNFEAVTIASLPSGYKTVEKHQAVGSVWITGASGAAQFLWAELDTPGGTDLIKTWNNNANVPRSTSLRLMFNFPYIIREA